MARINDMSLRTRLLLGVGAVTVCALLLVDVTTYVLLSRSQIRQVDDALQRAHSPIEQLVEADTTNAISAIGSVAPGTYVAVIDQGGIVQYSSPAVRPGDDPIAVSDDELKTLTADGPRRPRWVSLDGVEGDGIRVRVDQMRDGRVLVTGQTLHEVYEVRRRLLWVLVGATAAAIAAAAAIGWWLVGVGLAPLRRVEAGAQAISDGDLADQRVPGAESNTEVGQLAATLNAMLDRLGEARDERERSLEDLRASEARMRRFVADASHELRTPVAATSAYAELFDQGARSRPDDLARAMTGIRSETSRMARLIEDLLALARLDEQMPLDLTEVDLTEVVLAAVDAARAVAPDREVRVKMPDVVLLPGDRDRLRQVVDNLLSNVRSHTPPGTGCVVELRGDHREVTLTVTDEGAGLPVEDLERIFDRFYRVDEARVRAGGGSGLGLSIVESIVAAHGGSITASRAHPQGLSVTVRLPRKAAPVATRKEEKRKNSAEAISERT